MDAFAIGVSALQVSQKLIDITGQNIANASTPGYHRQVVSLAPIQTGNDTGDGVTITGIDRQVSGFLETALLNNTYESQDVTTQLTNLRQIQSYLEPATGSSGTSGAGDIGSLLSNFFNQVQQLAASPTDQAQRSVVINTAQNLADTINSTSNQLSATSQSLDQTGANIVDKINKDAQQIASLNGQIQSATAQGQQPNDLLDQRDQLISNLSQLVDVRVIPNTFNEVTVMAAGAPIVAGTQSLTLQYQIGANNQAVLLRADQASQGLNVTGGQAAGLLQIRNGDLPQLRSQLDTLTQALVQGVDETQATGIGLSGPLTSVSGTRGVSDPAEPLSQASLAFPPSAGTLAISVTHNGTRSLYQLNIDPTTENLNQVASAISGIPNLTASVNTSNNTLQITAANGYSFDFAGRLPSSPTNVSGNIAAQVGGSYTGSTNDNYTFQVSGSGVVGQSSNLSLNVYDGNHNLLNSFNIGQGYTPGSTLPAVNGVTASIGTGTLTGTESFQVPVTANPDTGNLLTALGLNTLFTGSSAATLGVRSDLLTHPELLSGSLNGDTGDGSNFTKIANLQNALTLDNGTQTIGQYFASMVGTVGVRVQDLNNQQTAQTTLGQQLTAQQQAVSGVDTNEELTNLLQYQRSFQMASEYINVVNQTLTTLMGIIPITTTG
jgi:flagellar hook-associated protein 1 FlgK